MTENMKIWDALAKTDPKHTKQFKRSGGFSGTAIKPIWITKMLTEQFGPVGSGWGVDEPSFQVVPGENREVLVYCTVACWHTDRNNRFFGVGGDKVVSYLKADQSKNRPERWDSDDEAFKKAYTDAIGNAFKLLGVGADVHMGLFDDMKYRDEMAREFAEPPAPAKAEPLSAEAQAALDAIDLAETNEQLKSAWEKHWASVPKNDRPRVLTAKEAKKTGIDAMNLVTA